MVLMNIVEDRLVGTAGEGGGRRYRQRHRAGTARADWTGGQGRAAAAATVEEPRMGGQPRRLERARRTFPWQRGWSECYYSSSKCGQRVMVSQQETLVLSP